MTPPTCTTCGVRISRRMASGCCYRCRHLARKAAQVATRRAARDAKAHRCAQCQGRIDGRSKRALYCVPCAKQREQSLVGLSGRPPVESAAAIEAKLERLAEERRLRGRLTLTEEDIWANTGRSSIYERGSL